MRATRDQIIAAQDAWQDAEKAYHDEAAKHVAVWILILIVIIRR